MELKERVRGLVQTEQSLKEVNKMTAKVVKQAAAALKPHKMDVSQGFSSNALLHAPDFLFSILAMVFRSWLMDGIVTKLVLACEFIPIVKAGKEPTLSGSYRAIAGSSLLLKLFERRILLVWTGGPAAQRPAPVRLHATVQHRPGHLADTGGAAALPATGQQASGRGA